MKQETVDRSIEVLNILRERTTMTLLPAGNGRSLTSISTLDSYIFYVRETLENFHYAQRKILVKGVLCYDIDEERHRITCIF